MYYVFLGKPVKRVAWSKLEKNEILNTFSMNILSRQVPRQKECLDAINKSNVLHSRSWKNIKYCVKNIIDSMKKN